MTSTAPTTPMNPSSNIFRNRNFSWMWLARLLVVMGVQIESVTLGWQVYTVARLTHSIEQSALLVGMLGLVQFIPIFALTLIAGETADRYDRRKILFCCIAVKIICSILLTLTVLYPQPSLLPIFAIAAVFGVSRAFVGPASSALGPMLVKREMLPKAIAWLALSMQGGMIIGPWLGGMLSAITPAAAYIFAGGLYLISTMAIAMIRANTKPELQPGSRLLLIKEGLRYVWTNRLVFGAISLDLFAVLLGGATALLPVFARDILHLDADGFGLLRSGPAIGAALMMFYLSRKPLQRHAGLFMLGAVGIFGVATIVFALSDVLFVSVITLAVLGAADAISVFVRQSLVQITTPDVMRGRVSAVSGLFISASNELGEFESGVVARFLGPVGAALFGGVGSIVITGLWAKWFPELRKADRLLDPQLK